MANVRRRDGLQNSYGAENVPAMELATFQLSLATFQLL